MSGGEGPPRGARINEPRVSSEGTLDGLGSCAPKEAGDGDGDGDGSSAVGRCALSRGEEWLKFVDRFRRLRNARFSWICSGGLSTAVLGR